MEEDEFRTTYHQVNPQRCCFEKALLARWANCNKAQRFSIGEREGVACTQAAAQTQCRHLLQRLHENAHFALGLTKSNATLPHTKEMKVQIGGLLGLRQLLETNTDSTQTLSDVHTLLEHAMHTYANWDNLPYDVLVRCIVKFEIRNRR